MITIEMLGDIHPYTLLLIALIFWLQTEVNHGMRNRRHMSMDDRS